MFSETSPPPWLLFLYFLFQPNFTLFPSFSFFSFFLHSMPLFSSLFIFLSLNPKYKPLLPHSNPFYQILISQSSFPWISNNKILYFFSFLCFCSIQKETLININWKQLLMKRITSRLPYWWTVNCWSEQHLHSWCAPLRAHKPISFTYNFMKQRRKEKSKNGFLFWLRPSDIISPCYYKKSKNLDFPAIIRHMKIMTFLLKWKRWKY